VMKMKMKMRMGTRMKTMKNGQLLGQKKGMMTLV
jgi:hypothetical protein